MACTGANCSSLRIEAVRVLKEKKTEGVDNTKRVEHHAE